jgi:hypothetical protein
MGGMAAWGGNELTEEIPTVRLLRERDGEMTSL